LRAFPKGSVVLYNILTQFAWAYAANNLISWFISSGFQAMRTNLEESLLNVQKWVRSGKKPNRNNESMIKGCRRDT